MAAHRTALLAVLALALASGCPVYNQECSPLLSDPEEITGWLGGDVQTIKSVVRTRDNSFGQLVAEAYYYAFDSSPERLRPDVAMQNSGSIRSEGVCVSREVIKKGPVRRGVLREVLPFDNGVLALHVTHRQLKNILEHAVAGLSPGGTTNPAGAFMQLYGATVEADCNLPGETVKADGSRDREGQRITAIALHKRDGTTESLPLNPPSDEKTVRLAVNSFVGQGGDNFVDLKSPNQTDLLEAGGYDFEIIAERFRTTYTEGHPLPAAPAQRWVLTDCH